MFFQSSLKVRGRTEQNFHEICYKSQISTILKIAVKWWKKVVGPQNWNGEFFGIWGSKSVLQKFRTGADSVRNFCRFRIAKKHWILWKTPHFETALSFSMFKRARGVKKDFLVKLDWKTSEKTIMVKTQNSSIDALQKHTTRFWVFF